MVIKMFLSEYIYSLKLSLKLYLAIKLADIKQKAFNKQFFVVMAPDGNLVAINNNDIKRLKRMKMLDKHMSSLELKQKCFYYTSESKNNKMSLSEMEDAKQRYIMYHKKTSFLKLSKRH